MEIASFDQFRESQRSEGALATALIDAASRDSDMKKRNGLNPNIDGLASSNPADTVDRLVRDASTGVIDLSLAVGNLQKGDIALCVISGLHSVFRSGIDVEQSQDQVSSGPVCELFVPAHLRENTNSLVQLLNTATERSSELYGQTPILLERVVPPLGKRANRYSRKEGSLFKNGDSMLEQRMLSILSRAGFNAPSAKGYHFRDDDTRLSPTYSVVLEN